MASLVTFTSSPLRHKGCKHARFRRHRFHPKVMSVTGRHNVCRDRAAMVTAYASRTVGPIAAVELPTDTAPRGQPIIRNLLPHYRPLSLSFRNEARPASINTAQEGPRVVSASHLHLCCPLPLSSSQSLPPLLRQASEVLPGLGVSTQRTSLKLMTDL